MRSKKLLLFTLSVVLISPKIATAQPIRYFGYFHARDRFGWMPMESFASHTNMVGLTYRDYKYYAHFQHDLEKARALKLTVFLDITKLFVIEREEKWYDRLRVLSGWLHGCEDSVVLVIDRPYLQYDKDTEGKYGKGVKGDRWQRDKLERAIAQAKRRFPTIPVNVRFQFLAPYVRYKGIPGNLDLVSLIAFCGDITIDDDGKITRADFDRMTLSKLRKLKEMTSKPIILVGESHEHVEAGYVSHPMSTPEQQDWYFETAIADERIIGVEWFMWGSGKEGWHEFRGANESPAVIAKHKELFNRIKRGPGGAAFKRYVPGPFLLACRKDASETYQHDVLDIEYDIRHVLYDPQQVRLGAFLRGSDGSCIANALKSKTVTMSPYSTRTFHTKFGVPPDAPPGNYQFVWRITRKDGAVYDEKSVPVFVRQFTPATPKTQNPPAPKKDTIPP